VVGELEGVGRGDADGDVSYPTLHSGRRRSASIIIISEQTSKMLGLCIIQ
jgi:hypothetical protein